MSKFKVIDYNTIVKMDISHLILRWERTMDRTCPVTGSSVTFEQVLAGQYSLPRIGGDSENGYEVWPTEEYLRHLADKVSAALADY